MNYFLLILLILLIIHFVSSSNNIFIIREGIESGGEVYDEDDNNPMKADYTKQIKTPKQLGFSDKGTYKSLNKNVKASQKIISGLFDKQKDIVKGNRAIGTKLPYNTGFKCNAFDGSEHDLYTYLDNTGNENDGLIYEFGNATAKMFSRGADLFAVSNGMINNACSEVNLKTITNSGKSGTQKVYLQNSEISQIDKNNIV